MINIIEKIYKYIFQVEFLVPIISLVATLCVQILKNSSYKEVNRERLDKVLFPIYLKIEKYLFVYDENNYEFIIMLKQIGEIMENNRLLTGHKLYNMYMIFKKQTVFRHKKNRYMIMCDYFIDEYSKSRKKCGLSRMPISYRVSYKLYKPTRLIKFIFFDFILCPLFYASLFFLIPFVVLSGIYIILKNN
jgi:hypothetical protein